MGCIVDAAVKNSKRKARVKSTAKPARKPAAKAATPAKRTAAKKTAKAAPAQPLAAGKKTPAKKTTPKAAPKSVARPKKAKTIAAKSPVAVKAKRSAAKLPKPVRAKPQAAADVKPRNAETSGQNLAPRPAPRRKTIVNRSMAMKIELPDDYRPSEDEPFMSDLQREYFKVKLQAWKNDIIRQTRETIEGLNNESSQHADLADRATSETDRTLELRARDRQRKLVAKINAALARIEDGSYGYCDETGEPISLRRLDARPIATLSIEAQERHERRERVYRDD